MIKLPRLFVEGEFTKLIHPLGLSIIENITPLSTATITLLQEEALPPRSYIELYTPYGSAGMFRVRNPRDAYGNDITAAELEHMISEVGDYVVKTEINEMMPAAHAIDRLFHYYEGRCWALGDIEPIGLEEIAVEIDHESVLDGILDVMSQCPDCFLQFDFSQQPWRINVARKSVTVSAEGRLSRNVSSAIISYDDTELVTRLWYKDYTNSDEGEWTFIDAETIEDYGIIEGKVDISADMTYAEKWKTLETYLYEHKQPKLSIEIQAAELSRITGERMDQFRIGDRMRLALPDYNYTESEIITKVEWSDVINAPNSVNITMGDEEDTVVKYIHDSTSSGGGGGGGGSKTLDRLYYEFWSEDGYLHSRLEMDYQHLQTEFWEGYNYLSSRVEQTARYWQAEFVNMYDGLRGFVELTAEHWQTEFQDTYAGLSSRIEQTASYWQAEFTDMYNGLRGFVELTAEHWQSEFTDTYAGLSSRIEQTAQHWQSELSDTYNGLSSRIEQTAGYWSSYIGNVYSGLSSRVLQTENSWSATVQAIGSDGSITAATIATAINEGKSNAWIDADNVWIGNSKSTTVIAGKLEASDITTDFLSARIATIPTLRGIAASFSGNVSTTSGVIAYQVYADGNNISNPAVATRITGPSSNVYTMQYQTADGTWHDAGTFSRATSLSGAWSGNKYTVTASPQGNTASDTIAMLTQGNGSTSFSVSACHTSAVAANVVATQNLYLTEDTSAKKVYARAGSSSGTAYGGISTQATYDAGANSVTLSQGSWSEGAKTVTASNGKTQTVSIPATSSTTWKNTTGRTWVAALSIGGATRNSSAKDFGSYYTDGFDADHSACIGGEDGGASNPDKKTEVTISPNGSVDLWPYLKKADGTWTWGEKCTVSAPMPSEATWEQYWPTNNVVYATCKVAGHSYSTYLRK